MIESTLMFIVGVIAFWPVWIALFLIAIFAENVDGYKTSIFFSWLLIAGVFLAFNIHAQAWWSWYYLIAYPIVGLFYSMLRWKVYSDALADKYVEQIKHSGNRSAIGTRAEDYLDRLTPGNHAMKITAWVLAWPTSIAYWTCSDMIVAISKFVVEKFGIFYTALASKGRGKIEQARAEADRNLP